MLSQLGQDYFVLEVLAGMRGGFFLDSGAADGLQSSNTYLLESSFDWTGICIEPDDTFFARLVKNRSCQCLNCCLYDREGIVEFVEAKTLGGIFEEYHPALLQHAITTFKVPEDVTGKPKTVHKPARTVRSVLRQCAAPAVIDYWSLDTEGSELAILKSFPFDEYSFRVLTVEHNRFAVREEIKRFLEGHGYWRIKEMGIDDCYVNGTIPAAAGRAWRSLSWKHLRNENGV